MEQEGSIVNLIVEHLAEIMIASLFFLISITMIMFMNNPEYQQQNLVANEIYDSILIIKPGTTIELDIPFEAEVRKNANGFEVSITDNIEPEKREINLNNIELKQGENMLIINYSR